MWFFSKACSSFFLLDRYMYHVYNTGITLEIYVDWSKTHQHKLEGLHRPGVFQKPFRLLPRTHILLILWVKCMDFTKCCDTSARQKKSVRFTCKCILYSLCQLVSERLKSYPRVSEISLSCTPPVLDSIFLFCNYHTVNQYLIK